PAEFDSLDDLPMVEEMSEKEMSFDDLPEDAQFIGAAKDDDSVTEENEPLVEEVFEDESIDDFQPEEELSTQDKIKEELAAIDELDEEFGDIDENLMSDFDMQDLSEGENLQMKSQADVNEENIEENMSEVLDETQDEFANLNENDIMLALGEELAPAIVEKKEASKVNTEEKAENLQEDEMVNELSKSIAQTITSSITDDTLKAALKGMKMNININISFDEDKH
ncbi:TPA: hypothetical protein R1728_001383, partial [Campylobacter lari]|nr:hypothetical protein [Campylobacter lari]